MVTFNLPILQHLAVFGGLWLLGLKLQLQFYLEFFDFLLVDLVL